MMNADTSTDSRKAALENWLAEILADAPVRIAPASADASFRRYFRVWHGGKTYIAMDAPPGREDLGPFIEVAGILAEAGVNVPTVLECEKDLGFLLLTDLGSRQYLAALRQGAEPETLYRDAIAALVRIQAHAGAGTERLPVYDAGRLRQEMGLFPDWFLGRHLGLVLSGPEQALIDEAMSRLVEAALAQPQVLVHRDYHSRNLMVCDDNPGILDFQDAVRGPSTYDLVSLLKDCYICWPRPRVLGWVDAYRAAAEAAGLPCRDTRAAFIEAFDLMGLQRHLKVLGIFCRLWYRDGKPAYLADLPRVLDYTLEAAAGSGSMAALHDFLRRRVAPGFPAAQARAGVPA
jgi:aminoglycoside/choline kinase family phosphotransferase